MAGGVNKVEYEQRGFFLHTAKAGDVVTIDGQNARKVLADARMERTEEISGETKDVILNYIKDPDYVYEGEGEGDEEAGEKEAQEQGADGNPKKDGNGNKINAAINVGATMFSTVAYGAMGMMAASQNMFVDLPYSVGAMGLGMGSVMGAMMFDPDLLAKISKMSDTDQIMEVLDVSLEDMTAQIEALSEEEAPEGEEGEEVDGEAPVDAPDGEVPGVEDVPEGEETPPVEDEDVEEVEDPEFTLDEVIETNTIAHESELLAVDALEAFNNSRQLSMMAAMNSAQLAAASAMAFVMAARAGADAALAFSIASALASNPFTAAAAAPWFTLAAMDTESIAQFNTAGGLFAGASVTMAAKSVAENMVANKEQEIVNEMNQFEPTLAEHDELAGTEETEESEGEGGEGEGGEGGEGAGGTEGAGSSGGSTGGGSTGGSSSPTA